MSEFSFIYSTFSQQTQAEQIVSTLLTERLIACANIIPGGQSIYHWKGKLQSESEVYVLLKTSKKALVAAKARLAELHPYETPCIIELDLADVNKAYADWLRGSISEPTLP